MINKDTFKLSIIIPCYNEKQTIKTILKKVIQSLQKYKFLNYEILIIDDHSKDGTVEILKNISQQEKINVYFHERNLGKGAAIQTALKFVTGDVIIIQDADLEYDPDDYYTLIQPIINQSIKVVYGSRVLGKDRYTSKAFTSLFRIFCNHMLTILSNIINFQKLTDAHTCYKVFSADIFNKITLEENGFNFCPEVTTKLSNLGINILEVPINYNGRSYKEGKKIRFIDGLIAIKTLFKYKFFKNVPLQ